MTKRTLRQRLPLFLALCALLLLGGFALRARREAEQWRLAAENGYRRAFSELAGSVTELEASMRKLQAASSPELVTELCLAVFGETSAAQTALSELPFADYGLETVSAWLSRLGDYARSLARQPAEERSAEPETLRELGDTASLLAQNLLEMNGALERGELRLSPRSEGGGEVPPAGEAFSRLEQDFPELPTLVYDGPFSQHLGAEEPARLQGLAEVTEAEARAAAAAFAGAEEAELSACVLSEGKLPLFVFSDEAGTLSVSVTRQGGRVVSLDRLQEAGGAALSEEEALAAARVFLDGRGFGEMKESYMTRCEGELLINFAAVQEGWVCYPDLVKVSVSLADGAVLGFEGAGWLQHHRPRELPEPAVSEEEARAGLTEGLTVLSHALCVIPSPGERELFCHEFQCEDGRGEHVLVYVNVGTGRQEKILCLIEDENGTLTR